jgi:hypothetical protein
VRLSKTLSTKNKAGRVAQVVHTCARDPEFKPQNCPKNNNTKINPAAYRMGKIFSNNGINGLISNIIKNLHISIVEKQPY